MIQIQPNKAQFFLESNFWNHVFMLNLHLQLFGWDAMNKIRYSHPIWTALIRFASPAKRRKCRCNMVIYLHKLVSKKNLALLCTLKFTIDIINNKAKYNPIDVRYQQMAFRSVPINPYLDSLVKQNWCRSRELCLHSAIVFILPNWLNVH